MDDVKGKEVHVKIAPDDHHESKAHSEEQEPTSVKDPAERDETPPVEEVVVSGDEPDLAATRGGNSYAAKKTVAQGMMDIALITSNANQLRYMMEYASESRTYYVNLFLISVSLILQVAVGISLLFKGRYQMKGDPKHKNVSRINSFSVIGVFLVTLINVFIASFTMSSKPVAPKPQAKYQPT
ncbi:ninjurin-A-like [Harmonia axyridis]|uniref:ninjurin-A-like n=1 Tax=Harmonia axyridis TaxID=115357 RepID=UPI001E276E21|nr:ninjurin-A-like [Harmonia axyridis]